MDWTNKFIKMLHQHTYFGTQLYLRPHSAQQNPQYQTTALAYIYNVLVLHMILKLY